MIACPNLRLSPRTAAPFLGAALVGLGAWWATERLAGAGFLLFLPMSASAIVALIAGSAAGGLAAGTWFTAFALTRHGGSIFAADPERMVLFAVAVLTLCHLCGRARAARQRALAQRDGAQRDVRGRGDGIPRSPSLGRRRSPDAA